MGLPLPSVELGQRRWLRWMSAFCWWSPFPSLWGREEEGKEEGRKGGREEGRKGGKRDHMYWWSESTVSKMLFEHIVISQSTTTVRTKKILDIWLCKPDASTHALTNCIMWQSLLENGKMNNIGYHELNGTQETKLLAIKSLTLGIFISWCEPCLRVMNICKHATAAHTLIKNSIHLLTVFVQTEGRYKLGKRKMQRKYWM